MNRREMVLGRRRSRSCGQWSNWEAASAPKAPTATRRAGVKERARNPTCEYGAINKIRRALLEGAHSPDGAPQEANGRLRPRRQAQREAARLRGGRWSNFLTNAVQGVGLGELRARFAVWRRGCRRARWPRHVELLQRLSGSTAPRAQRQSRASSTSPRTCRGWRSGGSTAPKGAIFMEWAIIDHAARAAWSLTLARRGGRRCWRRWSLRPGATESRRCTRAARGLSARRRAERRLSWTGRDCTLSDDVRTSLRRCGAGCWPRGPSKNGRPRVIVGAESRMATSASDDIRILARFHFGPADEPSCVLRHGSNVCGAGAPRLCTCIHSLPRAGRRQPQPLFGSTAGTLHNRMPHTVGV